MVEVLSLALTGFLMSIFGHNSESIEVIPIINWQKAEIFTIPTNSDPKVEKIVQNYLKQLSAQGLNSQNQEVWIQSEWAELANHRGNIPASAASLTKIATTLAAVATWNLDHRFDTNVYVTDNFVGGVLNGDLFVEGTGDPLFVWEEAIAVGNALNQLGITKVKGNLYIISNFSMNFKRDPKLSGELLKQALNAQEWTTEIKHQYQTLPKGTAKPKVVIEGTVQLQNSIPENARLLLTHQSLTLAQLLKQMNIYSNNVMAEELANLLGGHQRVVEIVTQITKISPQEIQLMNGSGLGVDNRISPHGVSEIFMALERKLSSQNMSITELFPVAGRDIKGTMQWRNIPQGVTVKTGTLAQVSALAGMIPTKERGQVWFAIINSGSNIEKLRAEQDRLLQQLSQHWELMPSQALNTVDTDFLGNPNRNIKALN